jgi:hypothetical protein
MSLSRVPRAAIRGRRCKPCRGSSRQADRVPCPALDPPTCGATTFAGWLENRPPPSCARASNKNRGGGSIGSIGRAPWAYLRLRAAGELSKGNVNVVFGAEISQATSPTSPVPFGRLSARGTACVPFQIRRTLPPPNPNERQCNNAVDRVIGVRVGYGRASTQWLPPLGS